MPTGSDHVVGLRNAPSANEVSIDIYQSDLLMEYVCIREPQQDPQFETSRKPASAWNDFPLSILRELRGTEFRRKKQKEHIGGAGRDFPDGYLAGLCGKFL